MFAYVGVVVTKDGNILDIEAKQGKEERPSVRATAKE